MQRSDFLKTLYDSVYGINDLMPTAWAFAIHLIDFQSAAQLQYQYALQKVL